MIDWDGRYDFHAGAVTKGRKLNDNPEEFVCRLGERHALRASVESVMRLKRVDSHVIRTAQTV